MPTGLPSRLPRLLGAFGFVAVPGCLTAPLPVDALGARPLDVTATVVAIDHPSPPRPIDPGPSARPLPERLDLPRDLPGAAATTPAKRNGFDRALAELFPDPPAMPPDPVPEIGTPLTLADLQRTALAGHPSLRQAAADIEAARGAALQAGLPPNPSFGYEADTIGSGNTAGQQGAKYEQLIKTGGKLRLAQTSALTEVTSAQIARRKAEVELVTQVRTAYFAVLVAQEQLRLTHAISRLMDDVYRVEVEQLKAGQIAPYEPTQIRALAARARSANLQARNRYAAAWRQLAAAVGRPDLPPAPLAGRATMPPPPLTAEFVQARMLAAHTDLREAEVAAARARVQVRIAEVTPMPDVSLKVVVQKDYTVAPFATSANVEVGVPVPVWDRNQGGVQQAQGQLARALDQAQRVRLDLLGKLADAVERYTSNRQVVEMHESSILPDQVRFYKGQLQRHQQEPDKVPFSEAAYALETFGDSLAVYLAALDAQWKAAVDLAALAQLDDLYPAPGKGPAFDSSPPGDARHMD
jgi:cobalt-zinc-cadmium efflux system outer membrane protein